MSLNAYLNRLEDTIRSRQDIEIKNLLAISIREGSAIFEATLQFYDGSTMLIRETLVGASSREFTRSRYAYHYQDAVGELIFRYDNSPHFPDLPTYPSHKHVGDKAIAAEPPDLTDVLREIDGIIYPQIEES